MNNEELIKELQHQVDYWRKGYEDSAMECLDYRLKYEDIKNAYVDSLYKSINLLINIYNSMTDNDYEMKHARKEQ